MRSRVTRLLVLLTAFATRGTAADDLELSEQKIVNWPVASYWSRPMRVEEDGIGKAGIPSPPLPFVAVQPCPVADTRGNGAPIQGGAFSGRRTCGTGRSRACAASRPASKRCR